MKRLIVYKLIGVMITQCLIIFLSIIIPTIQSCNNAPSCFSPRIFGFGLPSEGFYNVKLHDITQAYTVKNYADFNQDMAADYIALTQSNKALIYLWNKNDYTFEKYREIVIQQTCRAKSLYLFDLNFDGILDFTIWGTNPENTTNCIIPYLNNLDQFVPVTQAKVTLLPTADPIYFSHRTNSLDNTGLLVFLNGSRKILHFDKTQYKPLVWENIFVTKGYYDMQFKRRHWNAFLDLTGDCLPDLILFNQKEKIQFWINKGDTFQLQTDELSIAEITSYTSFDINSDGGIDLIFSNKSSLLVYKNINPMQSEQQFCKSDRKKLPFNLKELPQVINLFDNNKTQIQIQTIHYGDMNIDGFPDLVFLADNLTQQSTYPYVFLHKGNFNSIQYIYSDKYNPILQNTFQKMKILSISFFDILENGIVDIFVNAEDQSGSKLLYGIYNHYLYQNSFFIKGSALLGPNSDVGCLLPGATFFWIDNLIDGTIRVSELSQYSQTAYDALQMPYVVNGLGKINDYVKFFTVSNYYQKRSWSTIIPNSQLSIYTTNNDPDGWSIKIYVLPNESIVVVIGISAFFLIILGAVLFYFKYKNYKQQQKQAPIELDLIG